MPNVGYEGEEPLWIQEYEGEGPSWIQSTFCTTKYGNMLGIQFEVEHMLLVIASW